MKNLSMTVSEVARILKKDPNWVRTGIISGWLPIGIATRDGEKITSLKEAKRCKGRINYYISPKLFSDFTGYTKEETYEKESEN